jgi:hypothetical protein
MFSNKLFLKIFAEKPDIFGKIPENILTKEKIEELRQIPRLAVGEVSGIHSMSSLLYILSQKKVDAFLPTFSYTGTEYGDWIYLKNNFKYIKKTIENRLRIYVADPVILGAPDFWWALNGRFASELHKRFGFFSQCYGCRLYSFALRVPMCKKINANILISCDIGIQNGNSKLQNDPLAFKYYSNLMSSFGIDLGYVYLSLIQQQKISKTFNLLEQPENGKPPGCVFKDNYRDLTGFSELPLKVNSFFETFAIPAAAKIISRTLAGVSVDYVKEAADTLSPGAKSNKKKRGFSRTNASKSKDK